MSVFSQKLDWTHTFGTYCIIICKVKREKCKTFAVLDFSGVSSVSHNKLPQLILGYIYILKYLQSNFIG